MKCIYTVLDPLPNYKIPRKKESDTNTVQNYSTPLNWGPPVTNIDSTGLASDSTQQIFNQSKSKTSNNNFAPITYNLSGYKRSANKEVPKNVTPTKKRPCKF